MPTYDYLCKKCGAFFELRLKFSDDVDQPCKECGEIAIRQFSSVPIVFKGGGWYVNDYGKKASSSGLSSKDTASNDSKDNKESKSTDDAGSSKKSKSDTKKDTSNSTKSSSES
jgi:putative FmdB family regulatory protein|tara:strand:- start:344 stop:682 length:339 start_codon:yes stop_codon:yes gene_type:complete